MEIKNKSLPRFFRRITNLMVELILARLLARRRGFPQISSIFGERALPIGLQ